MDSGPLTFSLHPQRIKAAHVCLPLSSMVDGNGRGFLCRLDPKSVGFFIARFTASLSVKQEFSILLLIINKTSSYSHLGRALL